VIPLTEKQQQVWDYLRSCERCPTFQEVADALGWKTKSAVHRIIGQLERKGFVSRLGGNPGGYRMQRSLVVHDKPRIAA
jgi:SOS-response transcriptional repressor LexA